MSRSPRLIAGLACASRGLSAFGAELARAEVQLDRMGATEETLFDVPGAWSDLLGAAQIASDRLPVERSFDRSPEANSSPPSGQTSGQTSGQPHAEAGSPRRPAATIAEPPNPPLPRRASAADPTTSKAAARPRAGTTTPPDRETQAHLEEENRPPTPRAPRDPMAAIGATQVVRASDVHGPSWARPMGQAPARSPAPAGLGSGAGTFHKHEGQLAALLNRIAKSSGIGAQTPGVQAPSPHAAARPAPGQGAPQAERLTATPVPEPTMARHLAPAARSAEEPGSAAGGLSRLLAKGRALGVTAPTVPTQSPIPAPASGDGSMSLAPNPQAPQALHSPGLTDQPPASRAQVGTQTAVEPTTPANAFSSPTLASPIAQDRFARDLADLLRREARAAGIDLDGGAP